VCKVYEIEPMGTVCKLTAPYDEFPRAPTLAAVKEGWPEVLSRLKSPLETGMPLAVPRNPRNPRGASDCFLPHADAAMYSCRAWEQPFSPASG
jgi:hypothetical protein